MLELRESQATRDTSTRYPDEVKELAYQLWAFMSSRNASEVSRQLHTEDYGAIEVPRETVAYWVREYKWTERAERDVQAIAPNLRHQAFSELLFAGLDGAKYIRRVNAGQEPPDKVRAMLAVAAVDRIGFSPVGKGMPGVDQPAPSRIGGATDLSDDELEARRSAIATGRVSRS